MLTELLQTLDGVFGQIRRPILIANCLLLVGVIGTLDHLTGYEISFSIFYLVPIGIAAWHGNRKLGLWMSIVSAVVWLVTDLTGGHRYRWAIIPFWNATVRLGFFVVVSHLLSSQRDQLRRESEWPIALSVGVAVVRPPYPPLEEALRAADELMYRAKRAGKNRVVIQPAALPPDANLA